MRFDNEHYIISSQPDGLRVVHPRNKPTVKAIIPVELPSYEAAGSSERSMAFELMEQRARHRLASQTNINDNDDVIVYDCTRQ